MVKAPSQMRFFIESVRGDGFIEDAFRSLGGLTPLLCFLSDILEIIFDSYHKVFIIMQAFCVYRDIGSVGFVVLVLAAPQNSHRHMKLHFCFRT